MLITGVPRIGINWYGKFENVQRNLIWLQAVNNTSVRKYWKILFYPSNTDTGTFYGGSTDIDTDAQYPKYSTDILVFPVFYSISILCLKPLIDSCYLRLLAL